MILADVMFVNGNVFMVLSVRKIKLLTVEHIQILTAEQITKILNKMINLYGRGVFIVCVILMDM